MSATEIIKNLEGLTQPTLWRWLSALPDVLAIGEGRSRMYGIARSEMGYPIVKVTEAADIQAVGEIRLLAPKGAAFLPEKTSHLKAEVFEDVPYFIWDLRPQGYLGKIFVSQHPELRLPQHWEDWREQDLYRTLGVRGDDLVGNLIVGNESFEQFQSQEQLPLPESDRAEEYPKLAKATLQGAHVGSSAGGEQPKFTAAIQAGKNIRHVIVKFSPPVADKAGRRWADLLFAENIALKLLNQSGYVAARSEAFESKGHAFIEVARFDRVGRKGRRGILSLGAIDDEYVGEKKTWTSTALKLHGQKLIKKHDADSITFLDSFGANIANSDRHFGNLSLFWELGSKSFGALSQTPLGRVA